MKKNTPKFDRYFFFITLAIVVIGLLAFISASLGILATSESKFYNVIISQLVLGFGGGLIAMYICMKIPYQFWRKYSLYLFLISVVLTALVFVPGLGFAHGGARRWVSIGPFSFQPVEFLKIAFIMYFSGWLVYAKKTGREFSHKIVPFVVMIVIVESILYFQPDNKSLFLLTVASVAMLIVSGLRWKTTAVIVSIILGFFAIIIATMPYVRSRFLTFVDPSRDVRGAAYQINQSKIAIGSGGIWGRGLGQSVQKFKYLPEPQGDSIFSVIAEEFGFVGTTILIIMYIFFSVRGYKIAAMAKDRYGSYLVTGLVTIISFQIFLNMYSMAGIGPLTGVPLVFISHGGTALLLSMASVGIILNVSTGQKQAIMKM